MLVSIELFGIQRDFARTGNINMPVSGRTVVRDALEYIREKYPSLPLEEDSFFITVNHELAPPDRLLKANDTVCILPYIGGG